MARLFCREVFEKYSEIFPQKRKKKGKPRITQDIWDLMKLRNEMYLT